VKPFRLPNDEETVFEMIPFASKMTPEERADFCMQIDQLQPESFDESNDFPV